MRASVVAAFVLALLALTSAAARDQAIPAHPRQLDFAERAVILPTADDRRVELAGGMVLYLVPDPTLPLVEISLATRVGAFLDPPGMTGLSLLTGSLLRRAGAGNWPANDFDDRIDDLGARLDSMAGTTRAGASLSVPSWNLDEALDLFFAMVFQPRFQPDRLQAVSDNLRESLSRRNQDPVEILEREWSWLLFGDRLFSTRPLTSTGLATIARQDLVDFHDRYWRPEGMILAVSGDFDHDRLLGALTDRLARVPPVRADPPQVEWPPPAPPVKSPTGLYHYEFDTAQAKVMLGHRLGKTSGWQSRDRFALEVVGEILGGQGAISRIAGRLRTAEGLVYRAAVRLDPGSLWPGQFEVFFDTRPQNVARAVEFVLAEIERMRSDLVDSEELEVVKQSLLARHRLRFDTAEEVAGYFAEDELIGRPHDYWQLYLEAVEGIGAAEVRDAASRYLDPGSLAFLVVSRWTDLAAAASAGASDLERITGSSRQVLPARDPLTMQPLEPPVKTGRGGFAR